MAKPRPGARMACAATLGILLLAVAAARAEPGAGRNAAKVDHTAPEVQFEPPSNQANRSVVIVAITLGIAGGVLAPAFARYYRRRKSHPITPVRPSLENVFETDSMSKSFFQALRSGPVIAPENGLQVGADKPAVEQTPMEKFIALAARDIEELRSRIATASRTTDEVERQKVLLELSKMLEPFKELCSVPDLFRPWQLASALEALLQQLARNPSDVTVSALKTVADALDQFRNLARETVKSDSFGDSPVRLLAVDDNVVCLRALSLALQKAFSPPDTAPNSEKAMVLAAQHRYDIVFLDVEMPGVDGFALCSAIHQTAANRATPVVFVTRHSDLRSRAKAALCGGNDLIGKPFLALEITVKALTLILGSRRQHLAAELEAEPPPARPPSPASIESNGRADDIKETTPLEKASPPGPSVGAQTIKATDLASVTGPAMGTNGGNREIQPSPAAKTPSADAGGLNGISIRFQTLKRWLGAAMLAPDDGVRQESLGRLYVEARELPSLFRPEHRVAAQRLSAVLVDLLRKLLDRPALCTTFVLEAAADALNLLEELAASKTDPDIVGGTVRILVVDDDPIARRVLASSIQLAFGRPQMAESGEAAVELAAGTHFDLIFLDVLMPGMDGFATCVNIRQTDANRETPILFVTSLGVEESRQRAVESGGTGFITKPVLPNEILLRTLTLTLRRRLATTRSARILARAAP